MFYRSLFVFFFPFFLLAIVLSVLHRFIDSDKPFSIFKLLLPHVYQKLDEYVLFNDITHFSIVSYTAT